MNVILDNMVVGKVLLVENDRDFRNVREKLMDGVLKMVYGGKLGRDYWKSKKIKSVLLRLDQAGIACKYEEGIDILARKMRRAGVCRSDDEHLIVLALESGARLLCSEDRALHSDFTNPKLINKPRGRVYQGRSHRRLLARYCSLCRKG